MDMQHYELRSLFEWLVETVNLEQQVVFECGNGEGEVQVGGRRVLLHRMATWQLSGSLKLSVPLELQACPRPVKVKVVRDIVHLHETFRVHEVACLVTRVRLVFAVLRTDKTQAEKRHGQEADGLGRA
eukprot:symbB.v1.2.010475.t1/scaffold679.1/size173156/11